MRTQREREAAVMKVRESPAGCAARALEAQDRGDLEEAARLWDLAARRAQGRARQARYETAAARCRRRAEEGRS